MADIISIAKKVTAVLRAAVRDQPRQITTSFGYDGGPVFSRDGKHIAWRGNHPATEDQKAAYSRLLRDGLTSPMKMEIFVSPSDSSQPRQITNFGCASFAPTFTPKGKILFSSNKGKCDSREFELYEIDADGSNLRQLTQFGGFTSFPEVSPDGKKLVFVSTWKAKTNYEFNIFTADWKE